MSINKLHAGQIIVPPHPSPMEQVGPCIISIENVGEEVSEFPGLLTLAKRAAMVYRQISVKTERPSGIASNIMTSFEFISADRETDHFFVRIAPGAEIIPLPFLVPFRKRKKTDK